MASDKIQRTLAMVKPDAINRFAEIEKIILEEGFTIVERRRVRLTRAEAAEFYNEHRGKSFYEPLLEYITSGEVLALILAVTLEPVLTGEGAKEYLSHAVSPTLVRALTELCKVRPDDPIVWLADWLLVNNPNKSSGN